MSVLIRAAIAYAVLLGVTPLMAQPALSTIQDTLYKADGSRFDGYAFVDWKSFETANGSQIPQHSIVVRVTGGNLRVQLVPTTNVTGGAYYQVRFNSDGRIQFTEYWAVPPSSSPLALRDVRLQGPPGSAGSGTVGMSTTIAIPDVVGLLDELNNRPLKSSSYVNNRAAIVNGSGAIATASGNLTDCVRVDGSSISCLAGGAPGFVDSEVPSGTINGTNVVFTLTAAPNPVASLNLYKNGVLQRVVSDYTLSGSTITFGTGTAPQLGDTLIASYRTTGTSGTSGTAGGALTGFYPNPAIAAEVISNFNIASSAAIGESKLALNFPTHSNINDPSTTQKAALAGTMGTPSATNRYVTDQDARLSNTRPPTSHGLLSSAHGDTAAASPTRGDLIVGLGSSAVWTRLPLGAANRCLTSNGSDAVWNTCLFTGFPAGSIPFVDSAGNLSQSSALSFDSANKRLSVGNNQSLSTAYFYNAVPLTGVSQVVIRAGEGQGTTPLQRWVDIAGNEVASVSADGSARMQSFETRTTSTMAGFRDLGSPVDPSNRQNGDMWYNTSQQARRTMDAGQTHTQAQILCNSTGVETSSTLRLGSCFIPEFFLDAGDRIEIHFNYQHTGTASDWNFGVAFGPGTLISKNVDKNEGLVTGRSDGAIHGTGLVWGTQSYGSSVYNFQVTTGTAAAAPTSAFLVELYGTVLNPGTDTVRLLNFSVIRYPANANPF